MAGRFVLIVQIGILPWKCPNLISFYGLRYLLFRRSLGHRFGAGAAPFGSAFRTRVPRPPGFGLLPPRRLRVSFQKLLLLATRRCRDLGAAHL
jgi:hypothetical protein